MPSAPPRPWRALGSLSTSSATSPGVPPPSRRTRPAAPHSASCGPTPRPRHWHRAGSAAPLQVLARLHVVAAAGLVPDDALGRPRLPGEAPGDGADLLRADGSPLPAADPAELPGRLGALADLLAAPAPVPALVVAALAHAEIATLRPFVAANGVVARAVCRALLVGRGLDPSGVAVWEAALLAAGPPYPLALAGYAAGHR